MKNMDLFFSLLEETPEELAAVYLKKIDWMGIIGVSHRFSPEFLTTQRLNLDWGTVTNIICNAYEDKLYTDAEIEYSICGNFRSYLDWEQMTNLLCSNYSYDIIENFINYIDIDCLSTHPNVYGFEEVLDRFKDHLDWSLVLEAADLREEFLLSHKEYIFKEDYIKSLFSNQNFSAEFIGKIAKAISTIE